MNRFDLPQDVQPLTGVDRDNATRASRDDRSTMLKAMHVLEAALAEGSPARERAWRKKVVAAAKVLEAAMRHQHEEFDADEGLLQQVVNDAPRLSNRIEELRRIHQNALTKFSNLANRVELTELPELLAVADVRDQLAEILATIRSVQAVESDLIYEAYQVDLGGGG
jgi:hypothetical protein